MSSGMRIGVVVGGAVAVGMMIASLWSWQHALDISADAGNPQRAFWAMRSGAVGAAALAQLLLLTFVVGGVYPRRSRWLGEAMRLTAAVVFAVALVSAVAFGFAGL
jgi:hypothetical protein